METGTVKWFSAAKRYGFIIPDKVDDNDDSGDIFVHITELEKAGIETLVEGQRVGYDVEKKNNKVSAINIKLIWSEDDDR